MPRDLDAVYAFLASRSLPYVGPATAQKIIEKFGTASLDVIANEPARLTEIKGISADKADRIQQEFKRMFGMRELIAYLAQFEIGPRRPWRCSAPLARGLPRPSPPTPICCAANPSSWISATPTASPSITRWKGTAPSGWKPPCCGRCATMRGNGHTCLPRERLVATASAFIHQLPEKLTAALENCLESGELASCSWNGGDYIYLPDLLGAEESHCGRLAFLVSGTSRRLATLTGTSRCWN